MPFQIFCVRPKLYLHIVLVTNILCQTKRWFAFSKIGFCAGTKVFEEALNAVKFLGWLKKFGLAQNILGPVKGQAKSLVLYRFQIVCEGSNFLSLSKNVIAFMRWPCRKKFLAGPIFCARPKGDYCPKRWLLPQNVLCWSKYLELAQKFDCI